MASSVYSSVWQVGQYSHTRTAGTGFCGPASWVGALLALPDLPAPCALVSGPGGSFRSGGDLRSRARSDREIILESSLMTSPLRHPESVAPVYGTRRLRQKRRPRTCSLCIQPITIQPIAKESCRGPHGHRLLFGGDSAI